MNITLSADDEIIRKARDYARARQTTLNQMVRDYLARLVEGRTPAEAAEAFRRNALAHPGRSPAGWKFDRNSIHRFEEEPG